MTRVPLILIIEDDSWLAGIYERQLMKAGFVVDRAGDGLEGMSRIDERRPDAIILDVFLPGPNGIVLLHEIRSHSDLVNIPIVVCTTSAADIPKGSLATYGVSQVLDKSVIEPIDVVAAVKRVLP